LVSCAFFSIVIHSWY